MLVSAVDSMRFQMHQELLVSQDHLSTVAASAEEIQLDINAFHAQQDKLLIQITFNNALLKVLVITSQSDLLEIPQTAEDAKDAISQVKFQINREQLVLPDHLLTAVALREEPMEDTPVLPAQLDKSETQLLQIKTDV